LQGFFFKWYGGDACYTHNTLISITLLLCVLCGIFAGAAGGGAFPVASLISLYATYLLYAALSASHTCNAFPSANQAAQWLGYIFTLLALCYAAFNADLLGDAVDITGISCCGLCPGNSESEPLLDDAKEENISVKVSEDNTNTEQASKDNKNNNEKSNYEDDKEENKEQDDGSKKLTTQEKRKNTIYFHLILCLAACYMAMLLTDWGTSNKLTTQGKISEWVNIVVQWISIAAFWQSLLMYYRALKAQQEN